MGDIVRSEVGRPLSPGFGSIRIFPRRRRRAPLWLLPMLSLMLATLVGAIFTGH